MPSLTFVLPHWLYWAALLVFPIVAQYLVARQKRRGTPEGPSLFIGYLFWFCAGFAGMHRFYLRSMLGFVFIPVFLGILFVNGQIADSREDVSRTHSEFEAVQTAVKGADGDAAQIAKLTPQVEQKRVAYAEAEAVMSQRRTWAAGLGILMAAMLLIDAVLMPRMIRRRRAVEAGMAPAPETALPHIEEIGTGQDPTRNIHTRVTDAIEWLNVQAGQFVAYWAVLAVFAYYYEVIARYVFNSPTNWVHESMFLMFGMQYMICGAYAYREDQHVRVDVFYAKFSERGKAIADIVTSLFFFIFTITMLWTGWRFALDAINNGEHSFTEWGVQYWPVKLMLPLGALLIALQGLSKLIKDVLVVIGKEA
jgi:TRAP-type mannitol/chloroaromatic compound transport system permease small subunit